MREDLQLIRMKENLRDFFYSYDPKTQHMPFMLEVIGTSYCDGAYLMKRSGSNLNVIEYIISGTGTVESSYGTFHPSAGDSYLLRAGEAYTYYSDADNPWVKIWFNCYGTITDPVLDSYGLTRTMFFPGLDTSEYIKKIHAIGFSTSLTMNEIMNQCCVVFLELCQFIHNSTTAPVNQVQVPEHVLRLREYLDYHLNEPFTMEKCSKITYLSVSQTIRTFRAAYGMAPYEYLNNRRIETAKLLLHNSALSIQEISERIGFQDKDYFSKYFKKKCGVTPGRYRKEA